jgi:hypothetical protein
MAQGVARWMRAASSSSIDTGGVLPKDKKRAQRGEDGLDEDQSPQVAGSPYFRITRENGSPGTTSVIGAALLTSQLKRSRIRPNTKLVSEPMPESGPPWQCR